MVAGEIAVYPFDSDCGSLGLGFMAMEAVQMVADGLPIPDVLQRLAYIRQNMNILLTPDTLKYVQMSGRISALGSAVASLLNIKPIIMLNEANWPRASGCARVNGRCKPWSNWRANV